MPTVQICQVSQVPLNSQTSLQRFGRYGHGGDRARAREAVLEARRTGVRDPHNPYTMTAAEHRLWKAEQDWLNVQADINPYSSAGVEQRWGLPRTTPSYRVSDVEKVRAEKAYRAELARQGLRFGEHPVGPMLLGGPPRAGWSKPRKLKPKLVRPEMKPHTNVGSMLAAGVVIRPRAGAPVGATAGVVVAGRGKSKRKNKKREAPRRAERQVPSITAEDRGIRPVPLAGVGGGGRKPPGPRHKWVGDDGFEFDFNPWDPVLLDIIYNGKDVRDSARKQDVRTVGGHGAGNDAVGKRAEHRNFPDSWDIDTVGMALEDAMRAAAEEEWPGGNVNLIHYYDGVKLNLRYNKYSLDIYESVHFFPM